MKNRRLQVKCNAKIVDKAWGYELWIHNDEDYCGKVLHFNKGAMFSMHYHLLKDETWYVSSGKYILYGIDPDRADEYKISLNVGDVVEVKKGMPHQLYAVQGGDIFEISTQHFDEDSYRVGKGDSQQ
jgi:mannose-6-phosphate isomerase-like protein (cupin superfamily)